jgi:hypothetical protein
MWLLYYVIAAALVSSSHMLYDIASKKKEFSDTFFMSGYMLASIGRGILHGDLDTTGNKPIR